MNKTRTSPLLLLAAAMACQDYTFNPVGHCILQPGNARIRLNNISTADILFVVDDSGSMDGEQKNLADNFRAFIEVLNQKNADRMGRGLDPLDYHIAVTSSSIFRKSTNNNGGNFSQRYPTSFNGCTQGLAVAGALYPRGAFMAAPGNSPVLHFTKELYQLPAGQRDAAINGLVAQFQANIKVGSCGSGNEQHLEAAKMALDRVAADDQPGMAKGEFLHPGAKLIVVWVADEDDCSNPEDPLKSLTQNECTEKVEQLFPLSRYTDHLFGLGRPFAAGVIVSANACKPEDAGASCVPALCQNPSCIAACDTLPEDDRDACKENCGGKSSGVRILQMGNNLRAGGVKVVAGSVCDASFGTILGQIAELAVPIEGMELPTLPAAREILAVRIERPDGSTRRQCNGPTSGDPEWFFVECGEIDAVPYATRCIRMVPGRCEANPDERYVGEYLGRVTDCADAGECASKLGGRASDWTCDKADGQARGSCLCASQK
jgi:hypothetical protein